MKGKFFVAIFITFISCNLNTLRIEKNEEIGFRILYSQDQNTPTLINNRLVNVPPTFMEGDTTSSFYNFLKKIEVIKGDSLNIDKIIFASNNELVLNGKDKSKVLAKLEYDFKAGHYSLLVKRKNQIKKINLELDIFSNAALSFVEINDNNYPDLIIYHKNYIMNGDNFYLTNYRIK